MARIRTVKPEFWSDESLSKLPFPARLLFIGLLNLSDDYGISRADSRFIKSQLFPYDDSLRVNEVSQWIDQLVKARMLIPFVIEDESYLYIRTFHIHQKIDKPSKTGIISSEKLKRVLGLKDTPRTFGEYSANIPRLLAVGKERKGEERKGEEPPPPIVDLPELSIMVSYNAEETVLKNPIRFEQLCMRLNIQQPFARDSLRKFHLHLAAEEKYPKGAEACFAGFEKWLMNEKNFSKPDQSQPKPYNHAESDGEALLAQVYGWKDSTAG